ncbi:hypothetical protein ACWEPL_64460 [Nonomuraea sp. NPDC004186]
MRAQLEAAEQRNTDLTQQVVQARRAESEARNLVAVRNSRIEAAERERDNARAEHRSAEQRAEQLQTNLNLLLQRLLSPAADPVPRRTRPGRMMTDGGSTPPGRGCHPDHSNAEHGQRHHARGLPDARPREEFTWAGRRLVASLTDVSAV